MTGLENKFVIVNGYYIQPAQIETITPDGVLLIDGRMIHGETQ